MTKFNSGMIGERGQGFNRHERRAARAAGLLLPHDPLGHGPKRAFFKAGGAVAGPAQYTAQNNANDQAMVLANAQPMVQLVQQGTIVGNNAANGQTVNQPLNNVGLNTKLTLRIDFTIAHAAAETLLRTQFGLANILSNIQVTDLSNYQRVNVSGAYLYLLACLRRQTLYGNTFVNDAALNMGSNWLVNFAPSAVQGAVTCRMFFEIPLAYSEKTDLRGAIFSNVTSAQWRLQFTFNNNPVVAANAADATNAVYQSNTNADLGVVSGVSWYIYQHYYDQLPRGSNGLPIVPLQSLSVNYLLNQAAQPAPVVSQDNAIPYPNFRTILSTMMLFDNAGTLNTGSDINYMGIQVANLAFVRKVDPYMNQLETRNIIGTDPPKGLYITDHRQARPINTNQFGNTTFVLNPSQVNAGASLTMFYEMLAVQAQALNAGALSTGG